MRTLVSVLDAAVQRMASEVTLESEQPVIYKTARGSEAEREILERPALFDMLATAVSDELQVELMLGNPIEFVHETQRVKWQVRAVPGADAMVVRANRVTPMPTAIPLPDEGDISISEAEGAFGFGFDDALDPDFDLDSPPPPPRPAAPRAATPSPAPATPIAPSKPAPRRDPVPAPFESGTWALEEDEDDLEFDVEQDAARARTVSMPASESSSGLRIELDEPSSTGPLAQVQVRRPRTDPALVSHDPASAMAVQGSDFLGVPADDDDGELVPDGKGGLRRRSSAKLAALRAAQGRTQEISPLTSPRAETRRELSALRTTPEAETHRELEAQRHAGSLATELGAGVLAYVLGDAALGDQLAHTPHLVVLDHDLPDQLRARVQALPAGAFIVIRREDPSSLLGWILRRLEDGFRVLIETGARSGAGARRILLGTDASARAEAWLACHPQVVVEAGEQGPTLRPSES